MATIKETQDELIEEFGLFEDWADKYEYLIDLGKKLSPMNEAFKTEENVIKGCQSKVWLHAEKQGDQVVFFADSEAIIVKGMISMLIRVLSNHTAAEIMQADLYFIDQIGMSQHLAQTRSNGLVAMVKQMKNYAVAFHAIA
ncbi:SufE family protein [Aquirufa regiilacus]|jgi:cysteine desulfuration protein SufE|uniref:SufE family protein n=1 Tax=Aquirufa regiilacus TaxID=3024868 RepID=A0ABU3TQ15_9BACT|nr:MULTISPECIES: SufE family protein [unclassified Aquirufa]MBP6055694.1 SufE family protein [Cytophagaceae bacterium]MBP6094388.1 SufE family protein [Cytophagaceae bacterium]MDT8887403.1 SufE family protein [Aquirufa sp. LEPPI-3A]MDU0807924.1 SufE family protein [Aquirufa sp. LEOWEIH-7C]